MPVNYTNRKGQSYTLYRGQTKTGKPRYYFGRAGQGQGEPVSELPPGFTISESVNGVVSLVKDRSSLIQPEEVKAVEAAVQQHLEAHRYRIAVKHNRIEIYEDISPDYDALLSKLQSLGLSRPGLAEQLQAEEERYAHYTPVLRFILRDPTARIFGAERMCYLGDIDGWLTLGQTGPVAALVQTLIPVLGVLTSSLISGEPARKRCSMEGEQFMAQSVDETFPHLTAWVTSHGWIEIGYDDYSRSFIRALDSGGMVWEGSQIYPTLESALQSLDNALAAWMKENGGRG